jgi:tetratricopeptide (TPR) repeat protein
VLLDKRKVGFVTKIGAVILAIVFVAMYVPLLLQPDTPAEQVSQQDQMKQMLDSLKLVAKNSPKDVKVWLQLASAYYAQNMLKEAAEAYEKAVSIEPNNKETHFGLSAALYGLGQVETATAEIQKVIEIDPKFAQSYFNLAIYQTGSGKVDDAIKNFEKYIELDPKGAQVKDAKDQIAQLKKTESNTAAAFESTGTASGIANQTAGSDSTQKSEEEIMGESLKTKALMGASSGEKEADPDAGGSFISIEADQNENANNPHQ